MTKRGERKEGEIEDRKGDKHMHVCMHSHSRTFRLALYHQHTPLLDSETERRGQGPTTERGEREGESEGGNRERREDKTLG